MNLAGLVMRSRLRVRAFRLTVVFGQPKLGGGGGLRAGLEGPGGCWLLIV